MTRPDFLLDGGVAYLLSRKDGGRLADLRKPLCLARELVRNDCAFRCYLDRNLPYRVREEDRALLDLLIAEHSDTFSVAPQGVAAEEYLLLRAAAFDATILSAVPFSSESEFLDRFPWLAEPGRCLPVEERDGLLSCPPFANADYAGLTAFDLYDDLLTTLPRP